MDETRTDKATRSIIFGIISKLTNIILPFIVRTVLIYKLGMDYAGLGSLFTSVLSVLSLAELGFGTALTYSMYKPFALGDKYKICQILYFYRCVYSIIGFVILIIGLLLIPIVPKMVAGSYPEDVNLIVLYLIYLANTVSSYFLFSYKQSLISAYMREDINSKIRTFNYVILYVSQIIVIVLTQNYYIYTIIIPVSTILSNVLVEIYTRKNMSDIVCLPGLDKFEQNKIFRNVCALIGHKLSGVFTVSFDNIVISSFMGVTVLAIYSNYYYIILAIFSCFLVFDDTLIPIIGNSMLKEKVRKNYGKLLNLQFIYVWCVGWCSICLACLYQHTIIIWVGIENSVTISEMLCFVAYFFVWKVNAIAALYKSAAGLWQQDKFRPYYASFMNLILNVLLVKWIGMVGALLATILIFAFINIPIENHVLFKNYFKFTSKKYYLRMLMYILVFIAIGVVTYYFCTLVHNDGILGLLLKLSICAVFPNVVLVIIYYKTKEFNYLIQILLGFWKKIRNSLDMLRYS